jgi:type II secretory pathway component PulF
MSVHFKHSKLARQIGLFTVIYAVVVAMMAIVVPQFRQVFTAFGATVPPVTEYLLWCSGLVAENLPLVVTVYLVTVVGYLQFRHFAPELREEIDSSYGLDKEVITIALLGLFVAAVLFALYLPIFTLGATDS